MGEGGEKINLDQQKENRVYENPSLQNFPKSFLLSTAAVKCCIDFTVIFTSSEKAFWLKAGKGKRMTQKRLKEETFSDVRK